MLYAWLVAGIAVCAIQAIRAKRLLAAALWLAGVSALVAITLYELGARQVAVVELSVGAGLVTVLFVFAISIAGDDAMDERELLPKPLALGLLAVFLVILGAMILPVDELKVTNPDLEFATVLWNDRTLDVLVQIVMVFTGVLCVLGLLTDVKSSIHQKAGRLDVQQPTTSGDGHLTPEIADDSVPEEVHA